MTTAAILPYFAAVKLVKMPYFAAAKLVKMPYFAAVKNSEDL